MSVSVVVVGDCIVDEIHESATSSRWPGGAGLNLAVGLRVLGLPSTLIAQLGTDDDGRWLGRHLRANGVVLRGQPGPSTGVAVSDRTDGEPRYRFNDAILNRRLTFGEHDRRAVADSAGCVVNSLSLDDDAQVAELRRLWASAPGVRAIDPNPRPASLRDPARYRTNFEMLAGECDLVKISDEDVGLLYPGRDLDEVGERMLGLGTSVVLLTRGSAGASVVTLGGRVTEPVASLDGPVVDTMGAGDATLAVLLAHLVDRGTPAEHTCWSPVLRRAMLVAAATCRRPGGHLVLPPSL